MDIMCLPQGQGHRKHSIHSNYPITVTFIEYNHEQTVFLKCNMKSFSELPSLLLPLKLNFEEHLSFKAFHLLSKTYTLYNCHRACILKSVFGDLWFLIVYHPHHHKLFHFNVASILYFYFLRI